MRSKIVGLVFAIVFLCFVAFLRGDVTAQSASASQTGGSKPPAEPTAGQVFKNLQVLTELKDRPQSEFWPNMDFISGSLSVSCDYCHVSASGPYDSDVKKTKLIARDMIKMTRAINEANFGGRPMVTCNTCHQGKTHPNGVPTPWYKTPEEIAAYAKSVKAAEKPEASPAPSASTLPDIDSVMASYRKAVGSETLKTMSLTGANNVAMNGATTMEISAIFPDRFRLHQSINGSAIDVVFNGERGWAITPQGTIPLSPSQMTGLKAGLELFFLPVKYAKSEPGRKVIGNEHVGDKSYYVVQSPGVKKSDWLYFDVQTGLLFKVRNEIETVLGTSVRETFLEDYRDVNGVRIPHQISMHFMGNQSVNQISEVKTNIDIDTAKFEPPPERKSIKVDPKMLDTYVGEYQFTPDSVLSISREGDKFYMVQPNVPQKLELFAATETDFFLKTLPEQITFVKNDKGQVTHAVLHQINATREMKKIK